LIPVATFGQWGVGYGSFVSNAVAIYDTAFNKKQSSDGDSKELNPAMQKMMRQNFASVLKGGLNAIYKALDVRLEGDNDDELNFFIKEMNSATANELINVLKDNKGRNFGNALRAMAFRELEFNGDYYKLAFYRTNFVEWSYKYEDYLSELQKVAGKISGAMKAQATSP
jgi:hypothetical protein